MSNFKTSGVSLILSKTLNFVTQKAPFHFAFAHPAFDPPGYHTSDLNDQYLTPVILDANKVPFVLSTSDRLKGRQEPALLVFQVGHLAANRGGGKLNIFKSH